ncbi:MAG: hypothetical protein KY476_16695 [Planctomycetes bacterium]|nr:hypothetical protein [Planctomycetota bacterium]
MHEDLLNQAERLAKLDPRRPRQTNLRRAVSSAYYAVFHFLVDQSCRNAIGAQHDQSPFRHVLGRAFTHSTMRDACKSFAGGTLKDAVRKGLPASFSTPSSVRSIAKRFVGLQDERHLADYDRTERFNRGDVLTLVREARMAIAGFTAAPASNERAFFLACLWAWSTLGKR